MRILVPILVWLLTASAGAQGKVDQRDIRVSWARGTPSVSFSAKHLADEKVRKELQSALRKRIVVTVTARSSQSNRTIVQRQFGCDVTRDLWEDGYLVRIANRTERFPSLERAINRCLVVRGLFVGDDPSRYEPFRGNEVFFTVMAEFNPISEKQCRELIRPTGSDDAVGPITVSIVRRRICEAERRIEFRGTDVEVPK
ncbi:MAG: hypothetical protein AAGF92_18830 [Myxococcota bacterium]